MTPDASALVDELNDRFRRFDWAVSLHQSFDSNVWHFRAILKLESGDKITTTIPVLPHLLEKKEDQAWYIASGIARSVGSELIRDGDRRPIE